MAACPSLSRCLKPQDYRTQPHKFSSRIRGNFPPPNSGKAEPYARQNEGVFVPGDTPVSSAAEGETSYTNIGIIRVELESKNDD